MHRFSQAQALGYNSAVTSPSPIPMSLNLVKDRELTIQWQDGQMSQYPISLLRSLCPCAKCKEERKEQAARKPSLSLRVLSGNQTGPLAAKGAELVGNYALRIDWSDGHGSGIYSFDYLRSIDPVK